MTVAGDGRAVVETEQAVAAAGLGKDGAAFQGKNLPAPGLPGRDLVDVDQEPAMVVFVVGQEHGAVCRGVLSSQNSEAVEVFIRSVQPGSEKERQNKQRNSFHGFKIPYVTGMGKFQAVVAGLQKFRYILDS